LPDEKSPNRKNPAFDKVECSEIAVGTVSEVRLGQYTRKIAVVSVLKLMEGKKI